MMKNYQKIPSPWTQLGLFMFLLGSCLLLAAVVSRAVFSSRGIPPGPGGPDLSDPRVTVGLLKFVQGLQTVLVFALPAFLYALLTFRERPGYFLGLRPAAKSIFFLLAIVLLFTSFPFESWLGEINKSWPLPVWMVKMEEEADKQIAIYLQVHSSVDIVINLILMGLLPAICEELCFRGALQRILINAMRSPWAGIVVTGLFFSAFHMQFQGFLTRAFLGVLLGAIYWYSGSLWVSILAHFFFNGIQVLAVSFYPKMVNNSSPIPIYLALISLVIVVGLLSVMRRMSVTTYERVYE